MAKDEDAAAEADRIRRETLEADRKRREKLAKEAENERDRGSGDK